MEGQQQRKSSFVAFDNTVAKLRADIHTKATADFALSTRTPEALVKTTSHLQDMQLPSIDIITEAHPGAIGVIKYLVDVLPRAFLELEITKNSERDKSRGIEQQALARKLQGLPQSTENDTKETTERVREQTSELNQLEEKGVISAQIKRNNGSRIYNLTDAVTVFYAVREVGSDEELREEFWPALHRLIENVINEKRTDLVNQNGRKNTGRHRNPHQEKDPFPKNKRTLQKSTRIY